MAGIITGPTMEMGQYLHNQSGGGMMDRVRDYREPVTEPHRGYIQRMEVSMERSGIQPERFDPPMLMAPPIQRDYNIEMLEKAERRNRELVIKLFR